MEAVCINNFVDNYNEIKVSKVPKPQTKHGEVLIQVAAAGVNFVDLLYRFDFDESIIHTPSSRGKHQNNRSLVRPPFILGLEFAGVVVSCSPSSKFSPGDRVFGGSIGGYAQFISVPEAILQRIPPQWDFVSAAGLGATAPVSYGALILRGGLKQGETVLIHAAAGGLGLIAVQIAKAVGAKVIATASSNEKLDIARRFGADECVNYTTKSEWWKTVLDLTGGHGVDVVYDSVGLVGDSLKGLKWKGRILIVGFAGREGNLESVAMNRVLLKQARLIGYRFGMTDRIDPGETADIWKGLSSMLDQGLLKPTVYDHEYLGLGSVGKALYDLSNRKVWGKAVIRIDDGSQKPRL